MLNKGRNRLIDDLQEVYYGGGGSGGTGQDPYKVNYIDDVYAGDIMALIGAPYSPDGVPVVQDDKVLFTFCNPLTGINGRGVYTAQVSLGNVTGWTKILDFGQDTVNGNSRSGDQVMALAGTLHFLHTFLCTSTPAATWQDQGTPNSISILNDGTLIDSDISSIDVVEGIIATSVAPGQVKLQGDKITVSIPNVTGDFGHTFTPSISRDFILEKIIVQNTSAVAFDIHVGTAMGSDNIATTFTIPASDYLLINTDTLSTGDWTAIFFTAEAYNVWGGVCNFEVIFKRVR